MPAPHADLSRPPLSSDEVRHTVVVPGGLWTQVRVVAETGSTNADLAQAAREGAAEGNVLVAERQLAGRGRLDRRWHAPAYSALTFSVLLRPSLPSVRLGWLPLLAGLALVDAVRPLDAALKWPNDLLVRTTGSDYGKCAGILAEAVGDAVVVGIGLNVAQRADELPAPVDRHAVPPTSLALAAATVIDRTDLLARVLGALADRYRSFGHSGGDPVSSGLAEAYRAVCLTIGRTVSVALPDGPDLRGEAIDVDADGRLVVETREGVRALAAGDVRHVR
jgi:BirA family biotin operon repressor/biotin-[acetyl-CoA-carboxylase] ligase